MTPYYEAAGITIYHADCREVLPGLDYRAVVTDPPYGIGAEYRPHGVGSGIAAKWDDVVPYEVRVEFDGRPTLWFGSPSNIAESYSRFDRAPDRLLIWAPRFTLSLSAAGGLAYRFHAIYAWDLPPARPAVHDVFTDPTECGNWWATRRLSPSPSCAA